MPPFSSMCSPSLSTSLRLHWQNSCGAVVKIGGGVRIMGKPDAAMYASKTMSARCGFQCNPPWQVP